MLTWFVPGQPSAQGSKRYVGRGVMLDTDPKLKSWRALVAETCPKGTFFNGPIRLTAVFHYLRPKAHYGRKQGEPYLKADAPHFKASKPDADKLARAIGDALTGVIYKDDAQIVMLEIVKVYAEVMGVRIEVSEC
jgi:crossover junction endodeoxyribonuclease RusA